MIFIDVARYLRRTWPELFVVEPGFAGLHRRIDPCRYDRPRLAVGWAKAPDATDRRTAGKIRLDDQLFARPPLLTHTRRERLQEEVRFARDLYGSFSVKWLFGLLPVFCSERKGRFSSRRLRLGSRSARKGSRDRNASGAWRLAALARLVFRSGLTPEHAEGR